MVADTRFELPPFYCPIDSAIHPEVGDIEKRATDWIDRVGIYDSDARRAWVIATNSAEFYARFAPDGAADNVLAAAQWVYWGFAFDDVRCDNGPLSSSPGEFAALAGQVQRVLEAPHSLDVDGDPYLTALHDIGLTLRECATPVQLRRFIDAHRAWLFGVCWQIGNQANGHMPDLNDYLAMRLGSCGGLPTMALMEIANAAEVPPSEMDTHAVRAASEAAILTAGLDNDLHSYRKEIHQQHADQNIINVLMVNHDLTLEQALTQAVGLRDRIMHLYLRLRDQIVPGASRELRTYLTCLGRGIRGNIDWALRVPRYTSLSDPDQAPGPAGHWTPGWATRPSDTRTDAPAIPAIAWWWDQLAA